MKKNKCGKDIIRRLKCIDNQNEENRLTVGKEYISSNDFLWDSYIITETDTGATNQVMARKYFEEIKK